MLAAKNFTIRLNEQKVHLEQYHFSHEVLGEYEVSIRVEAASLNYRDLLTLQDSGTGRKDNLVPLSDGCEIITAIGSKVRKFKVGDHVISGFFPKWFSGPFTPEALESALGGGQIDGVLREMMIADERSLIIKTKNLTPQQASTLPCAGVTAWHALFERGKIQPGQTVLVQGTGGVSLFGLQLAHAIGAKVIVTSSSDEKLEKAQALGAWKTINYRREQDWDQIALKLTEGRGVDHILELGGPETYNKSINAVAFNGHIYQIGVLTGFTSAPNVLPLQFKNSDIHGICVGSVEHLQNLSNFVFQHKIQPVIDKNFSFEEAPLAFEYLKSAAHFGKITLTI